MKKIITSIVFIIISMAILLDLTTVSTLALDLTANNITFNSTTQTSTIINITNNDTSNVTLTNCYAYLPQGISYSCSVSEILKPNESITKTLTLSINEIKDVKAGSYTGSVIIEYNDSKDSNIKNETETFSIVVEPSHNIDILFSISNMYRNEQQQQEVKITNMGNDDEVLNLSLDYPNDINASLNETLFTLAYNASKIVLLKINTTYGSNFGTHNIKLTASNNGEWSQSQDFNINYNYCSLDSSSQWLEFSLENKDSITGTFKPLDKITVKVNVKNKDDTEHYVRVSAILVQQGGQEIGDSESSDIVKLEKYGSDDEKNVELTMEVPSNVASGDYSIYVRAYDDDNSSECLQDNADLAITKDSHDIIINGLTVSPEVIECGSSLLISGELVNTGLHDEKVKLVYSDDYNSIEELYNINEDYSKNFILNVNIPKNATEGKHSFNIKVYFNYNNDTGSYNGYNTFTGSYSINGSCIKPVYSFNLNTNKTELSNDNNEVMITIMNTGNVNVDYSLFINCNWASASIAPVTFSLQPTQKQNIKLSIKPNENVTGNQTLVLKIRQNNEEITKFITFSIAEKQNYESVSAKATRWQEFIFEYKRHPFIYSLIFLFAIAIITLIIILVKLRKAVKVIRIVR